MKKDGVNYSAEIPRLNGGMVTSRDIFRDERQEEKNYRCYKLSL